MFGFVLLSCYFVVNFLIFNFFYFLLLSFFFLVVTGFQYTYRPGICFRMLYVFVSSILFWFPHCTLYFWRVFRFLFLERKQDSNVTAVKNVQGSFKDVSTKNSEPTYWAILFVMVKIYFIYKVAGKKSRRAI